MRKNGVNRELTKIEGGVCAPEGFQANAVACGIRKDGKLDFGMLFSEKRCQVACVYASTPYQGAPVRVTKKNMKYGYARAVLVNGGKANCIAEDGEKLAESVCDLFARYGIERTETVIASTGKIGEKLSLTPFEKGVRPLMDGLGTNPENSLRLAEAMATEGKDPKEVSFSFDLGDYPCKIGAVFKGGVSASPNMATFLAFLTTDANISSQMLQRALSAEVKETLNLLNVGGVPSPNDTVCILANGRAGNYRIDRVDSEYKKFAYALRCVLTEICKITADGADSVKTFSCRVFGARSKRASRSLSKKTVGLDCVKKGIAKGTLDVDALVCSLLDGEEKQDPTKIQIVVGSDKGRVVLFEDGKAIGGLERRVEEIASGEEFSLEIDLNEGNFQSTAYGRG